jgi:hypothetical protein
MNALPIAGWHCVRALVCLCFCAVSLAAATEEKLNLDWNEIFAYVEGRKLTVGLADGSQVEGIVRGVNAESLDMQVRRSTSNTHRSGDASIRREEVSVIRFRETKGNWRALGTAIGAGAGAAIGGIAAVRLDNENASGKAGAAVGIAVGAGAGLGYALGHAKDQRNVTILVKKQQAE